MSQPNQIDLSVDPLNDATYGTVSYRHLNEDSGWSQYIGDEHSSSARDLLHLYRTFPKKSGNFNGVDKSAIKVTRDVSVPGVDNSTTLVAPGIVNIAFSFPVGMSDADRLEMRQIASAALLDQGVVVPLNSQLMI